MIVVCGVPEWHVDPDGGGRAGGMAVDVARAAVATGARVELVGRLGDDPTGDALLLDLSAAGIGHVALLRDPGRPTPIVTEPEADPAADDPLAEPVDGAAPAAVAASPARPVLDAADLELGLRYLVDYGVVVLTEPVEGDARRAAADAAGYAGAHLIVLMVSGAGASSEPTPATVLETPLSDPDGAFAGLVGAYAAAIDRGADPATAFGSELAARGWEPAEA